jgi:hypothetical protein
MNNEKNEYQISADQAAYLRRLASEQPDFRAMIESFGITEIGGNMLTIHLQEAEILREYFTERLAKVGFDSEYKPNNEGVLLESLIDILFTPGLRD